MVIQLKDTEIIKSLFDKEYLENKKVNNSIQNNPHEKKNITTQTSTFDKIVEPLIQDKRDVVFVKLSLKLLLLVSSSIYMIFYKFSWIHFFIHAVFQAKFTVSYILMLHCCCHKNLYKPKYWYLELIIPYVLGPFLGQTLDSFYFHHVKHHHVEDNGPGDLSSTLKYQRDNWFHFVCYFSRFLFLSWIELPLYFAKKGWYLTGLRVMMGEFITLGFFVACTKYANTNGALCLLWFPFASVRFGMMSGNWGQHAFIEPTRMDDDYVQSITCINSEYNNVAFNDGYHTSHHLNPIRHWADHPGNLVEQKQKYHDKGTIIFNNLDFHLVWVALMLKDYKTLSKSYVNLNSAGLEIEKSEEDLIKIENLLRRRTKRFTQQEIIKYYGKPTSKPIYEVLGSFLY
ncbi:hypothetical protein HDU92_006865 [Lobulomyces angularis]|nr:hypothetical protein HDU92_006865 [Lobulomyces angularis]